jgi:predicted transcriptional regulator
MAMPEPCGRSPRPPKPIRKLPPEVLEAFLHNPTRKRIVDLIQEKPGMNQNQVAEALETSTSTITYHLHRLKKSGHLIIVKPPKGKQKLCFTPENIHHWQQEDFRILLGRGTPQRVAGYVTLNPGATTKQIAKELKLSVSSVQRHIRSLQDRRLVHSTRIDRDVLYHADPELVEWVERVQRR